MIVQNDISEVERKGESTNICIYLQYKAAEQLYKAKYWKLRAQTSHGTKS